jgi:hypothetical protein
MSKDKELTFKSGKFYEDGQEITDVKAFYIALGVITVNKTLKKLVLKRQKNGMFNVEISEN